MGVYPSKNKVVSLSEAVSIIRDGDRVAIGGNLSAREPMAFIREMIRQGKKNLHTIGGAHGIDVDLMCAGGIVGMVQNSYVGLEGDFGMAPNYRQAVEKGSVKGKDTDCVALLMQLRASAFGVPFMPMGPVRGTDILKLNPEIKEMDCPYTGQSVNLLPALRPDVAVIHAHRADPLGNLKIDPPYFADPLVVEASDKVIVSVEKIVSPEEMERLGATIPYYEVTALVEIPFGAHPTSCYPDYTYDRRHIAEYMEIAGRGVEAFREGYLKKYVFGPKTHDEYLGLVGGKQNLSRLQEWDENLATWHSLLSEK